MVTIGTYLSVSIEMISVPYNQDQRNKLDAKVDLRVETLFIILGFILFVHQNRFTALILVEL